MIDFYERYKLDMSITIKDVAKEAGVSVATVSRVLNGSCSVSEDAAKKVNDAINSLHYSPNFLGRNLRKCETNVILCIMPTSEHSLYSKIIMGMQKYADKVGYDIIACVTNGTLATEKRHMKMLFNRTVDGAVLLGTQFKADAINELAENYNIALCCEAIEGANVLTVAVDDEKATYDAVNALIKKGHKRIGFIGTKYNVVSTTAREEGYKKALKNAGIEFDPKLVFGDTYEYESGVAAFDYFNSLDEKPTAIFAISDLLAIGVIHRASCFGIQAGKDIDVMGFDDISIDEMMLPTVSTVGQPCMKMGELVVEKLINNIHNTVKDKKYYTVGHEIIMRQSTGD